MKKFYLAIIALIIAITASWTGFYFYKSLDSSKNQEENKVVSDKEQACLDSGGTVTSASCCQSAEDFPDNCAIGACGCAPEYSHKVKFCGCPEDKCFDGKKCAEKEGARKNPEAGRQSESENHVNSSLELVSYSGRVFSAKYPKGWKIFDNESGIEISDPQDPLTGATSAVAVGWFGESSPDQFIDLIASQVGLKNIKHLEESDGGSVADPASGLIWKMKTKTFTCQNSSGDNLKIKASAGVMNGYGQYIALLTAFQTVPEKWSQWAPMLERIAQTITITNPQMAGGAHRVRLPTAADLANDTSPLMEAWEYRNNVQDRASHNFSDAIMGVESDLVSPSTGRSYTLPLSAYDPTEGGYRNPDNHSEILVDAYE